MQIITSDSVENLNISPEQCVDWAREAFLIKDSCKLPPKISIHPRGSDFFNTMPCLLPDEYHTFGCKIVSRVKGTTPAIKSDLMVFNTLTGEMDALMDCNWITAHRTGAVATVAINTLQHSNSTIYSFVGLGVMAHATLDCFFATNRNRNITVRLKRYKDHAEKTIGHYGNIPNVKFEIADTMEELVYGADVIVSCITDADGLLVGDVNLFKEGVLVVPVHTRGFQNCDRVFDKVFADDEGHVRDFRFFNQFRSFGELGKVLSGDIEGRTSDKERILSYNIGLGLHDIYFGKNILGLLQSV